MRNPDILSFMPHIGDIVEGEDIRGGEICSLFVPMTEKANGPGEWISRHTFPLRFADRAVVR